MIRWENTSQIKSFFSGAFVAATEKTNGFQERFEASLPSEFMSWDPFSRAQYTEITIFLSNYLLCSQGDRMAMAHAVEGRFPFLDHRVVEFACSLPPRYRMHGLKEKYLLRKAAAGIIPSDLANRPKRPYRAPISGSILGKNKPDYVDELLGESKIQDYGYFDPHLIKKLVEKSVRQDGNLLSERENMAVIGVLSTQLLHKQFIKDFPANEIQEPKEIVVFRG
jgi:asparagine synthase (glutamine-hydrolysing)